MKFHKVPIKSYEPEKICLILEIRENIPKNHKIALFQLKIALFQKIGQNSP